MRHTGILTGTFDPVHNGHLAIARAAHEQCSLDAVWFWPNPDPTHKMTTASYDDRLAMLKLALMDEATLQVAPVSEISFQRPHTIENFQAVLQPFCDQRFSFIVGMDTLGRIDTWRNFESVVTNTSFIVIHRSDSTDADMYALLQRLGESEKKLRVELLDVPMAAGLSSTKLRQALTIGEVSGGLPMKVAEFALRNGIYKSEFQAPALD